MSDSDRGERSETLAEQDDSVGQGPAGDTATQDDQGGANQDGSQPSVESPPPIEAVDSQAHTEQPDKHKQADLQAQQDMAFWAMLMFFATLATVVISGAALWLLKKTLTATATAAEHAETMADEAKKATRAASEAAQASADATIAMVKANDITKAAQRPWLSIEAIPKKLARENKALAVEIDILTKNVGSTVAANYQLRFDFTWLKEPTDPYDHVDAVLEKFDPGGEPSRKVVLPNDSEVFPFWSYKGVIASSKAQSLFGLKGAIAGVLVISAFYKSREDSESWHRTDKAYVIGWKKDGHFVSTVTEKFRRVNASNLRMEPILAATLAD